MKYLIALAFIIALASLAISSFTLYNIYLKNPESISINFSIPKNPNPINLTNFSLEDYHQGLVIYENMRFPDKTITFSINSECNDKKTNDALNAFNLIQNKTNLKFIQVPQTGQIEIF